MRNNHYELVSGSIFGIVAALQAMRAIFQIPAQVGTHEVPLWISWVAVGVAGSLCLWAIQTARSQNQNLGMQLGRKDVPKRRLS